MKEVKFIMASCGSKHTLALDTSGDLWFFGSKQSVGIDDE
jgi:alpha-tubulin suppressor-like RCC1 family protein